MSGPPAPPAPARAHWRDAPAGRLAGVDEVGRGPLAGPVVAAAVMLPEGAALPGLADSKRLAPARRAALAAEIALTAATGIGVASVAEIDAGDILRAAERAMARALAALGAGAAACLVDGNRTPPGLALPARAVVGGDGLVAEIAAASIVAKVTRDRMMGELAARHPGYGWERNMGYGTAEHRAALRALGPTPEHRRSFRPVREILSQEAGGDS
jgi:ribonuclease HII